MSNDSIAHKAGSDKYWMPTLVAGQVFPIEVRIDKPQFDVALTWANRTRPAQGRMIVEVLCDKPAARRIARKLVEKGALVPNEKPRHYVMSDLARAHVEYWRKR